MVIAIASTGDVARRVFEYERPLDPGLVAWASSYLNEQLSGLGVGAWMIATKLADPHLAPVEAEFVATLAPAFTELESAASDLYLERHLAPALRRPPARPARADQLMTALERRADVLAMLRSSLAERSVFLWISGENPQPELRSVSVVGAPTTGSATATSAPSASSARCRWSPPRSPRSASPRASSVASRPSTTTSLSR